MTNLLNGKCRFAGTVTEEDSSEIPIASADGEYKYDAPTGEQHLTFSFNGKQRWHVNVSLGILRPLKPDGEDTLSITAELASGAGAHADYRMPSLGVDVHAMDTLRLIEEVGLRFVHVSDTTDPIRTITVKGSLSWRVSHWHWHSVSQ
jgi:hypothetical protein